MNKKKRHRSKKIDMDKAVEYGLIFYVIYVVVMFCILIHNDAYWKGRREEFYECTDKHKDDYKRGLDDGEKIWRHKY